MNPQTVRKVAAWIRSELRVPFVVVGGSAIERHVSVGTKDVDVLIAVGDWSSLDSALEHRRDATPLDPSTGTIRGTVLMLPEGRVDVEFISGQPFSGSRPGDDFVVYVRNYRSSISHGIRYADEAVVFYMRLAVDGWEANGPGILRDLRAGVPGSTLDAAVEIGRRFGRQSEIRERAAFFREKAHLFDPRRE